MGCDYHFSGNLPDTTLQEKVIDFVRSIYSDAELLVYPKPELKYRTSIELDLSNHTDPVEGEKGVLQFHKILESMSRCPMKLIESAYPFNFYGIIPVCGEGILEQGQFIFDRSRGGRLVRMVKLPESYGIPSQDHCADEGGADVCLREGGCNRLLSGDRFAWFALMLNLVKLRWWPVFQVANPGNTCRNLSGEICPGKRFFR